MSIYDDRKQFLDSRVSVDTEEGKENPWELK